MKSKSLIMITITAAVMLLTSCGVSPAVKELKKYNTPTSRYWVDFIKKNGINAVDEDGDLLLVTAVDDDNYALAKACIKSGADVNLYVNYHGTALEKAVKNNNSEMVKLLIKNKAVTKSEGHDIYLYIPKFKQKRNPEIIDAVMSVCNKNMLDYTNESLAYINSVDCEFDAYYFDKLFKKGYEPSERDYIFFAERMFYSEDDYTKEVCGKIARNCKKKECAKGISSMVSNDFGSEEKAFSLLKFMIENGADVERRPSPIIGALSTYTNFEDISYALNLLLSNNIEIDVWHQEYMYKCMIDNNDYEGLAAIVNMISKAGQKISYSRFFLPDTYKEMTIEQFQKLCDTLQVDYGNNNFISDYRDYIEEKAGLDSYTAYYVRDEYQYNPDCNIESEIKDKYKTVLNEIEELENMGFPLDESESFYKFYLIMANK